MEETRKHTQTIIKSGPQTTYPASGRDSKNVRQGNQPFQKVGVVEEGFPEEEGPQWTLRNGLRDFRAATAKRGAQDKEPWIARPSPLLMRG